jgi:hypothetical protein
MAVQKEFSNGVKTTANRVKKTRLYLTEVDKSVAGNSSALMDLLTTGVKTAASSINTRNAAIDIAHVVEDYTCSDYKCRI